MPSPGSLIIMMVMMVVMVLVMIRAVTSKQTENEVFLSFSCGLPFVIRIRLSKIGI